jgi:hypothetical protein
MNSILKKEKEKKERRCWIPKKESLLLKEKASCFMLY